MHRDGASSRRPVAAALRGADERRIGHRPAAPSPPAARAPHNANDDDLSPVSVLQAANDAAYRRHLDSHALLISRGRSDMTASICASAAQPGE
jgi:hypothetical protein